MCIRDRYGEAGLHAGGNGRLAHFVEIPRVGVGVAVARAQGCLLYTSDAADERSSVDLGGRRIIKKKTHGKNQRR